MRLFHSWSILVALVLFIRRRIAVNAHAVELSPRAFPCQKYSDWGQALCSNNTAPPNPAAIPAQSAFLVKPYPTKQENYYLCPPVQDPCPNLCCRTDFKIKYLDPGESYSVTAQQFDQNCRRQACPPPQS
ncbi:hypothetical protein PCANC_21920 [Puccinia coronata f. sp. avenae]|uniref:Uncharacterized protein n=1 Tax=Puccinia coronata f. sp. avenae TaxID=200324 RepID=A0A2N5TSR4_9BASI|nr:hypothetical protein PCANC_21920 [Puccinia coronata f. sp. avenae]